jgi:hypothetical protein
MLFSVLNGLAQDEPPKRETAPPPLRQNISGDFMLPTPVANKAFAKTVIGIADVHLSWHYPVFEDFYFGAGFNYVYMQINDFIVNDAINANVQMYVPFGVLGYEKFANDMFSYGFYIRSGYSMMKYFSSSCQTSTGHIQPEQQAFSLEPGAKFSLSSTENLTFGLIFSHHIIFTDYNASLVCLNNFSGMNESDSEGVYQFPSVGFCFTVLLGEEKPGKRKSHQGY